MEVTDDMLVPVTIETKQILENLASLYLHDLSEFSADLKPDKDGRFVYEGLDYYFERDELMPFFIRAKGEIAGFVLLNTGRYVPKDIDFSIHEFFVLRGFRRKGIAAAAVKALFARYRGKYKLEQLADNQPAIHFWKRLYQQLGLEFTETVEIIDEQECFTQVFSV